MGRPLNKKYFGGRNASTSGSLNQALVADARLAGTIVNGLSAGTAGVYTNAQAVALTTTFPAPALANGVTATGAPTFKYVNSASVTGTATKAYGGGTGVVSITAGGGTVTFTPTLTSSTTGISVTSISTSGVAVVASGTYITGQDFVVTGGTSAGTYYVLTGGTSVTSITLTDTYAHAIAGTGATFAGGTGGTAVLGATYNSIASLTLVSGGTFTQANIASFTGALAITDTAGQGAGQTITVTSANFGVNGATISQAGDGYLNTLVETPTITGTTVTSIASAAYGTITVSGTGTNVITLGTAQSAGTFYVGQVVTFTGSASTNFIDSSYSTGKSYVVTATNGTSTLTLALTSGSAPTGGAAGAVTGLTIVLYSVTLTSVSEIQTGFTVVTTGTAGGLTAGTYYVIGTPSVSLNQLTLSSTYQGNAFVITSTTTSDTITTSWTQYLGITFTGSGTTAVGVATLAAEVTSGYSGRYPGILCQAITTGSTLRQDSTILKQENYQRFKIENTDGTAYCKLVTQTPTTAGTFAINATDSAGGTYWVAKMTNHKARLIANTGTQFTSGSQVKWTFGSAVANTTVTIDNG